MAERVVALSTSDEWAETGVSIGPSHVAVVLSDARIIGLLESAQPVDVLYWEPTQLQTKLKIYNDSFLEEVLTARLGEIVGKPVDGDALGAISIALQLALAHSGDNRRAHAIVAGISALLGELILPQGDATSPTEALSNLVLVEDGGVMGTLAAIAATSELAVLFPSVALELIALAFGEAQSALSTAIGFPAAPPETLVPDDTVVVLSRPGSERIRELLMFQGRTAIEIADGLAIIADPQMMSFLRQEGESLEMLYRLSGAYAADLERMTAPEFEHLATGLAEGSATLQNEGTLTAVSSVIVSALAWRAAVRSVAIPRVRPSEQAIATLLERQIMQLASVSAPALRIALERTSANVRARHEGSIVVAALREARDAMTLYQRFAVAGRGTPSFDLKAWLTRLSDLIEQALRL